MGGPARRSTSQPVRVLVVLFTALVSTTGMLPPSVAAAAWIPSTAARTAAPDSGARARVTPDYFRPVTPVDITTTADGALPLTPDPTIGHGPSVGKAAPLPKVRTEIPALRTEHSRTFLNPDGTYSVEELQGRMNYQAPDGSWQPMDLGLVSDASGPFDLRVKASDRTVRFGNADAGAGLASLSADGHTIGIRAIGYGAADARAADDNRLSFAGSGPNGSLFAVPTDTGLEFGVTIDSSDRATVYHFALDTGDLSAQLAPDGRTVLLTSGTADQPTVLGTIDAPVMVGPDGSPADPGTVSVLLTGKSATNRDSSIPAGVLDGLGDHEVLVTYKIDPTWLHDPSRAFPVTLDPSVCVSSGVSGCTSGSYDEFIFSSLPTYHTQGWTVLRIGYDNRTEPSNPLAYSIMRDLFYFPDVALPDGSQVISAGTRLRVNAVYGSPGGKYLAFYRANVAWGTNSVTWNDIVPSGYDGASQSTAFAIPSNVASGNSLSIDLTSIARQWYTRRSQDWKFDTGMLMRMCTTTTCSATETSTIGEIDFYKYNNSNSSLRPLLTVNYVLPAVQFDFDAALGRNYAPSQMIAGQAVTLPITVKNTSSVTYNATNGTDLWRYRVGYRWLDAKGNVVGSGAQDLPADLAAGATSSTFGLSVTPPSTAGQYTLRLDLVHAYNGASTLWSSDWASPSKYYSRDKRIAGTDSTRWTGSSVIERDEFGITVGAGGGTATGDLRSVGLGDGSSLGIDLATRNLHFEGDTGLGFDDLGTHLGLTYGYDRANTADCTGILKACGWYTNWDERIRSTAYNTYDLTYQDPSGNRYLATTTDTGQISSGAPVQLDRPRVTLIDENPLPASANAAELVRSAASEGIPAYSGPSVLRTDANTSMWLGNLQVVDLNQYPLVSFAARSTAETGVGIDFKIHDITTGGYFWFIYELGTSFTTGFAHVNLGGTLVGNWDAVVRRNLYDDVYALHGSSDDDYEVVATQTTTNGLAQGGYLYVDAVRFQGRDDTETGQNTSAFFKDTQPAWTSNGASASLIAADKAVGTSSIQVAPAALASSPYCTSLSGSTCFGSWDLAGGWPFMSWYWKKVGGTSIATQFEFTDVRTAATKSLTYYAGALPSGVPSTCGPAGNQPCAIQVDDQTPEGWTLVTRDVLDDARQVLGFYYDNPTGSNPASPPSQGPVPDRVRLVGERISAVDGQYARFDNLMLTSTSDLDSGDPGGSQYTSTAGDDFSAAYADGSVHYFNADGLLTRVVDLDGNATRLDWTLNTGAAAGSGQAAYSLAAIHVPTDGTTNGSYTYQREIAVAATTASGLITTTFTESLGSTGTGGSTPTGRSAAFVVSSTATSTGSPTYGVGDLIDVAPARDTSTACNGARPTGCAEFSYSSTSGHYIVDVRDPRWDGSTSGASDFVTGVAYNGADPYQITDQRTGVARLYVPTFNRGGGTYRVAVYQTADMRAASAAADVELSPDGRPMAEYAAKPCTGGQCSLTNTTWPAAGGSADLRVVNSFDGLAEINQTTTYRTPDANPVTTQQGSRAGIRVDNYVDALAGGERAWTQDADQYAAWSAASQPKQADGYTPTTPYLTSYAYDEHHRVAHVLTPVANANGTNPTRDVHTTRDADGHPVAIDDNTWVANPGFESGLNGGWSTYGGTAVLDASTSHSGTQSVKVYDATTATDHYQGIVLLPGQTFRLQAWAKAASGSTATIGIIYQWKSDGTYHPIGSLATTSTAWTQLAADVTIPSDGTGAIHVDLESAAGQTAWYDDISLFTTYATTTFAANGLVTDRYSPDGASATGLIRTSLAYAATSVHPPTFPTTSVADYVDGTPGPGADQDVTSTTDYDRWGRTVSATDPDGVATTMAYAANMTDVASTTDGAGNATTYAYDAVGNRLSTTLPLGETTSTTYDLYDHPLVTTAPDGTKTSIGYDSYGRATTTIENYRNGVANDDGSGTDDVTSTAAYDAYGNAVTAVADTGYAGAIGATIERTYDLLGNVVSATSHTGNRLRNAGLEASASSAPAWSLNANWGVRSDGNATYVHSGSDSLQALEPASNPAVEYGQTYRISMTGGTTYDASAYVTGYSTNAATANIYLRLRFFKADGTYSDATAGAVTTVGAAQSWVKIGGLVTAPAGTVEGFAFFGLDSSNAVANDRVYIDDVSVDELRTTTTYFDAAGHAAGTRGPAVPSGAPAPACPGASGTSCNSAVTFDMSGHPVTSVDAYGTVTRTLYDLDGRVVRSTVNYVDDLYSASAPDTDLVTTTQYDLAGQVASTTDPLGRTTATTADALHRVTMVTRADGSFSKTVYTYGGRVDHASAMAASGTADSNLTWTRHVYDAAGRETTSLAHYDITGSAGLNQADFEDSSTSGWATSSSWLINGGATLGIDPYSTTAPETGVGRLRISTDAINGYEGVFWHLAGTYRSGHTYRARLSVLAATGVPLLSCLGHMGSGGYACSIAMAGNGGWQTFDFTWTPGADWSDAVLVIRQNSATPAVANLYADNVEVWDTASPDVNVPSESAYDADGRVVASVLPPGDPVADRPMTTTTAYDPVGRPVAVSVDATHSYQFTVLNTSGIANDWPLDERAGTSVADRKGGSPLTLSGGSAVGVAGGTDEARTGVHFDGTSGYVGRSSAISTAVDNFSLEAWFRADALPAQYALIAYNGTDAGGYGIAVRSDGHLMILYGSMLWTDSGQAVVPGRWYHTVLSRTNGSATLYLNGAVAVSGITTTPFTPSAGFSIGREDGPVGRYFDGAVDDVAFYTSPLDAAAVSAHYAAGRATATDARLTTRTAYDALGRATDTWNPAGVRTHYELDRLGRVVATTANDVDGVTSGIAGDDDVRSTYAYDALGEQIAYCPAQQVFAASCSPALSAAAATAWHDDYDAAGHQVTQVPPVNTTATPLAASYAYYDAGGRMTVSCSTADGSNASCAGTSVHHTTISYDAVGRPVTTTVYSNATTVKLTTTNAYDGSGAVTSTAFDGTGSSEGTDTLTFTYDTLGRPDQTKRGSTVLTDNTWNPDDTLASRADGTAGTSTFSYDWAKRPTGTTSPFYTGTAGFTWRLDGLLGSRTLPGDSITGTYAYDAAKRVTCAASD